ncbi:MAG: hypothetical protein EAZ97_14580 [Bacteroidetes bacterium]|nr:MAG: hypothetical protein EAZ97_14580 [Bacteroidota bacterium]
MKAENFTENLIIGAGLAGLAMAARLSWHKMPYQILEKSDQVAHSWEKHYDSLSMQTSKLYSALPHFAFPLHYPKYVPKNLLLEYCKNYAKEFAMPIVFGTEINNIKQLTDKNWQVVSKNKQEYLCKNLIVATGNCQIPSMPDIEGLKKYRQPLIHSQEYKNAENCDGKKVLVVGFGTSANEIAYELHKNGAFVSMSVQNSQHILYKDSFGFSSHEYMVWLYKMNLPSAMTDYFSMLYQRNTVGDAANVGINSPNDSLSVQLKKGIEPTVDVGTLDLIRKKIIRILPAIKKIHPKDIEFENKNKESFDKIIFATGYQTLVSKLFLQMKEIFNEKGRPEKLFFNDYQGLYFLGFRHHLAGTIYGINEDSAKILRQILG